VEGEFKITLLFIGEILRIVDDDFKTDNMRIIIEKEILIKYYRYLNTFSDDELKNKKFQKIVINEVSSVLESYCGFVDKKCWRYNQNTFFQAGYSPTISTSITRFTMDFSYGPNYFYNFAPPHSISTTGNESYFANKLSDCVKKELRINSDREARPLTICLLAKCVTFLYFKIHGDHCINCTVNKTWHKRNELVSATKKQNIKLQRMRKARKKYFKEE